MLHSANLQMKKVVLMIFQMDNLMINSGGNKTLKDLKSYGLSF